MYVSHLKTFWGTLEIAEIVRFGLNFAHLILDLESLGFNVQFLPPQRASATEEAVIASRVDIGLESRNFVVVAVVALSRKPIRS